MRQDDARKLDHATLEALRIRAVLSVQDGESPEVVARSLRIGQRTMYGWWRNIGEVDGQGTESSWVDGER